MEADFQKLKLRSSDLSTVHEFDERSTLTKENVKLLEKQKILQKYMDDKGSSGGNFEEDRFYEEDYGKDFDDDGDGHGDNGFDFDAQIRKQIVSQGQKKLEATQQEKEQHQSRRPKSVLKSSMATPIGSHMYTLVEKPSVEQGSASSFSSRTPSSVQSQYSETDTENSDYAADYDDFEEVGKTLNLQEKFRRKQQEAKQHAEEERLLRRTQHTNSRNKLPRSDSRLTQHYDVDDITEDADFEDLNYIDPAKIYRFKANPSPSSHDCLDRKKSLPVMRVVTSVGGSPKKVKKYLSSMDMNSKLDNYPKQSYPVFDHQGDNNYEDDLDDLENLDDFDLTITLSDYKKLKRRSKKIDFSQYVETPPQHQYKQHRQFRDSRYHPQQHSSSGDFAGKNVLFSSPVDSKTARLTKEGKIKLIRSLGKPMVRKVMPAHIYGEIVYDPQLKKWCGNEEDLARFEMLNYSKPQLITKKQSMPQIIGNMFYDDKKLRWVSVTGNYEDDPFGEDFDTIMNMGEEPERAKPSLSKSNIARGVSGKLVPSESAMSLAEHLKKGDNYFKVTPEMYKIWKTEEGRWVRKVGNWFPCDEDQHKFKYELKTFLNQQ
ncbi:hypothetical protein PMKS-001295 [Pichia membranifaciens]|uniref:Uncharacterized protein n=1 Tax=Pichia membranifaciens TaxID=4926 RepID=A0A1Q2YE39_9ASCO|nr:hypothetical protein PMKS-001295 [Pichia membranifaciens]